MTWRSDPLGLAERPGDDALVETRRIVGGEVGEFLAVGDSDRERDGGAALAAVGRGGPDQRAA